MAKKANKVVINKRFSTPIRKTKEFKYDENGNLLVTGFFTSDKVDQLGDIITKEATERAVPPFKQWGNIRYMHRPEPVGKVLKIGKGDGLKWNEMEIKVVDKKAANQVKEELLSAFSVGIMIDFGDIDFLDDGGWQINDYVLAEISLVDHPANYDATISDTKQLEGITKDALRLKGFILDIDSDENTEMDDEIMTKEIEEVIIADSDHSALEGLADDENTQYITDGDVEVIEEVEKSLELEVPAESEEEISEEEVTEEEVVEELEEEVIEEEISEEEVTEEIEEEKVVAEVEDVCLSTQSQIDKLFDENEIEPTIEEEVEEEVIVEEVEDEPVIEETEEIVEEETIEEEAVEQDSTAKQIATLVQVVKDLTAIVTGQLIKDLDLEEILEETPALEEGDEGSDAEQATEEEEVVEEEVEEERGAPANRASVSAQADFDNIEERVEKTKGEITPLKKGIIEFFKSQGQN